MRRGGRYKKLIGRGRIITRLYNIFTMHHIMPHDFYGAANNEMSQKLMMVFSDYEVKKHNDSIKK